MRQTFKTILLTGAAIVAFGAMPATAQTDVTAGANVEAGARIQDDGITVGPDVEKLMEKEDALTSPTITGDGLSVEGHTDENAAAPDSGGAHMNGKPATGHIDKTTSAAANQRLVFNKADANGDGNVDKMEFSNGMNADTSLESFDEFDANKDGILDSMEYDLYLKADLETSGETEATK